MLCVSNMKVVKGVGVGDEAVIGELQLFCRKNPESRRGARIALLAARECDFDLLFEVSQEYMGFICLGEYDGDIAQMAEELRLVGIFSEDEKELLGAINEKTIILPKNSKALLAPDLNALKSFECDILCRKEAVEERPAKTLFSKRGKKIKRKIKKYSQST